MCSVGWGVGNPMNIDWKEFTFIALPSALAAGGTAWYGKKKGAPVVITALACGGAAYITFWSLQFIKRRIAGTPEQLPDAQMASLPSGQAPVVTPTANAALGRVAEREKAVADSNVKPTNPQEVGSNVVDLKPSESVNLDAFGSMGTV